MQKGITLNYFGKYAKVVDFNHTHVLIQFESGTKLCTNRNLWQNN